MNLFKLGTPPTLNHLVAVELYEAEIALLKALTGLDFAKSEVAYQSARITRLKGKQYEIENPSVPKSV